MMVSEDVEITVQYTRTEECEKEEGQSGNFNGRREDDKLHAHLLQNKCA